MYERVTLLIFVSYFVAWSSLCICMPYTFLLRSPGLVKYELITVLNQIPGVYWCTWSRLMIISSFNDIPFGTCVQKRKEIIWWVEQDHAKDRSLYTERSMQVWCGEMVHRMWGLGTAKVEKGSEERGKKNQGRKGLRNGTQYNKREVQAIQEGHHAY